MVQHASAINSGSPGRDTASIWFFAYRNLEPPAAPSTPNPSAIIPSIARDRGLHGLPTSQQRALPQSERLVARGQTRAIRATWARGKRPYAGEAPVASKSLGRFGSFNALTQLTCVWRSPKLYVLLSGSPSSWSAQKLPAGAPRLVEHRCFLHELPCVGKANGTRTRGRQQLQHRAQNQLQCSLCVYMYILINIIE